MPDSLISNHSAYVASLRCCPPSPDQLSVMTGMRRNRVAFPQARRRVALGSGMPQYSLEGSVVWCSCAIGNMDVEDDRRF
jgi:hypothetical protein